MRIRTRLIAAASLAAATVAVPVTMALTSASAHAANDLCVHLFVAQRGQPPIINEAIIVLPPISLHAGPCPA